MTGDHMYRRKNIVRFFAAEVDDAGATFPHLNDNCCPHCGGAMAPGDRAADCSSLQFRSARMVPNLRMPAADMGDRARVN